MPQSQSRITNPPEQAHEVDRTPQARPARTGATTPGSLLALQRSAGNAAVVDMLANMKAGGRAASPRAVPVPVPVSQAPATVRRKVNNLPTKAYATGAMASIKSLGSKKPKQVAFELIQAKLREYNGKSGSTAIDLADHARLLSKIGEMVAEWCDLYAKAGAADSAHAKQTYMQFDLKQAIVAEEDANSKVVVEAPKGAAGGRKLPGMNVIAPPSPPPPPPPRVKKKPPPLPSSYHNKPDAPASASSGSPLAEVKESKEPVVELTQFQQQIQHVYTTLAAREATTAEDVGAWTFIQELYPHINEFGDSIMSARSVDEKGRVIPGGSAIKDKQKLDAILASMSGGNKRQMAALLAIPALDEKEVGLGDLNAKLEEANQAIRALGTITPEITATFAAAAVNTGRIATAKGLTGLAVGVGMSAVPVPGVSQAFSMAMAINKVQSTVRHIRRLQKIQLMAKAAGDKDLVEMLDYIIAKKQAKKYKSGVGGIPFASAVSTVGFKMKGAWKIFKGTRGEGRKAAAAELIETATGRGPSAKGAQLTIMELVNDLVEYKEVILGGSSGAEILARKMASA